MISILLSSTENKNTNSSYHHTVKRVQHITYKTHSRERGREKGGFEKERLKEQEICRERAESSLVKYALMVTADLQNLTDLQPAGGCDDCQFTYLFKCKFCKVKGTVTMIPGRGQPLKKELADSGKFSPIMLFDCDGYEPLDFAFTGGWKAKALSGTEYVGIDLAGGEFFEYDEKGAVPVMISNIRATFEIESQRKLGFKGLAR